MRLLLPQVPPRIRGRVHCPFDRFVHDTRQSLSACQSSLKDTKVTHDAASAIGHELLLASEFCTDEQFYELLDSLSISELRRFDLVRHYRLDIKAALKIGYDEPFPHEAQP